jgi:hypothetical protein
MARSFISALGLTVLAASSCTTEVCGCSPAIVPAILVGRVLDGSGRPAAAAQVRAYSAPDAGCHSLDTDFGFVVAEDDGGFVMELASGHVQDSVCVLVFARPSLGVDMPENSDTSLLVLDFRDNFAPDTARVELVLRGE